MAAEQKTKTGDPSEHGALCGSIDHTSRKAALGMGENRGKVLPFTGHVQYPRHRARQSRFILYSEIVSSAFFIGEKKSQKG